MVPWIHMSWPNRLPCFLLSLLYIKNDNRYCLYSAYYLSGTGYFTYINSLNPINMKMNLDREQQKYYKCISQTIMKVIQQPLEIYQLQSHFILNNLPPV